MGGELALLPWQWTMWGSLTERLGSRTMAHALLLTGRPGCGQREFADVLINAALCLCPNDEGCACGNCKACHLVRAGTHPDLLVVTQSGAGEQIKVDQIRDVIGFLLLSRQYERYRVVVIHGAERMNANAANALLKILEEPPAARLIVLLTTQPSRLPATVRSRCQRLRFPVPPRSVALPWLAERVGDSARAECLLTLANGAPIRALEYHHSEYERRWQAFTAQMCDLAAGRADLLELADSWSGRLGDEILPWWAAICADVIRSRLGIEGVVSQARSGHAQGSDIQEVFAFYDRLLSAQSALRGNANRILLVQDLLLQWYFLNKPNSGAKRG